MRALLFVVTIIAIVTAATTATPQNATAKTATAETEATTTTTPPHDTTSNSTKDHRFKHSKGIKIFKVDFKPIAAPVVVCVWILMASLAKVAFHHNKWLSSTIPESCVLILLGILVGSVIEGLKAASGSNEGK